MKWRDLGLTLGLLLILAPYLHAQTQPAGGLIGGVAGFVRAASGSAASPSVSFAAQTNTGFYLFSAGNLITDVGGANVLNTTASGIVMTQTGCYAFPGSGDALNSAAAGLCDKGSASLTVSNAGTGPASLQTTGSSVTLAVPAGAYGFATSATTSVGNTGQGARLVVVCGPTAGTASLLFYAGTTNTPVVLANAVGGGLIGC